MAYQTSRPFNRLFEPITWPSSSARIQPRLPPPQPHHHHAPPSVPPFPPAQLKFRFPFSISYLLTDDTLPHFASKFNAHIRIHLVTHRPLPPRPSGYPILPLLYTNYIINTASQISHHSVADFSTQRRRFLKTASQILKNPVIPRLPSPLPPPPPRLFLNPLFPFP